MDEENEKLKAREIDFLNYLKTKQNNNPSLVENINVIAENKRVVDNINKTIESEHQRIKDFEDSLVLYNNNINNFETNMLQAINGLKDSKGADTALNNNINYNDECCSTNKLNGNNFSRLDFKSNSERNTVSFTKSLIQNQNTKSAEDNGNLFESGLQPQKKNSLSDAIRSNKNLSYSQGNIRKIFEFSSDMANAAKNSNKKTILN